MSAPRSGSSDNHDCSDRYSSSVRSALTLRVNTGVSMKTIRHWRITSSLGGYGMLQGIVAQRRGRLSRQVPALQQPDSSQIAPAFEGQRSGHEAGGLRAEDARPHARDEPTR